MQKKSDDYGKFENGNKISFNELQRYIEQLCQKNFYDECYPQMKKMAQDTVRAVFTKLEPQKRCFSFEVRGPPQFLSACLSSSARPLAALTALVRSAPLRCRCRPNAPADLARQLFGFDFMIDESLHVWLIEVNTNPCLECSGNLLSRIIPNLVENVFRIAVDPMYPPPNWPKNKKKLVPESIYESNKFEIFFDELVEGPELRQLLSEKPAKNGHSPSKLPQEINDINDEDLNDDD